MNWTRLWLFGLVAAVIVTTGLRLSARSTMDAPAGSTVGAPERSMNEIAALPASLPPVRVSATEPVASAAALYVLDVDSAYPLYAQNETTPVPIASVTKLMTALVALDEYRLDEVVTVSQEATRTIGSGIDLVAGEQITVHNLLRGLLIQSGNDAAMALAEHKGYDRFIEQMNEKAALIGLAQTQFQDPAGLDDSGYSTARDLGILAAFALRSPILLDIVSTVETTIDSIDGQFRHHLETSNRLLKGDHPLYLGYVTGLKTGFTPEAGHCLVASAKHGEHQIVTVVLNTDEQTPEASAKESRRLITWAFDAYAWPE
ncbi:D-alanyl-D-alanine carboxypeptidase [Candidatus Berkelbacteria bacterium]|nr:D-alanyl-D-alanine carboxypeptidase [Candidatus Berkelbacteria bacterium]